MADPAAPIRAVLFDLDGVLTTDASGSLTTLRYLHRATGLAEDTLWQAFAPYNEALLDGRTTHADAWPAICEWLGVDMPFELLDAAFRSTPIDGDMLDLARRLATEVRVGIVTDNKRDRVDSIVRLHALDAVFDPIVVSADVGSGKRATPIFERALAALSVAAHEVVFIDNTPANRVVPASMGMYTLHFDDAVRDVDGLAATLASRFGVRTAVRRVSPASA